MWNQYATVWQRVCTGGHKTKFQKSERDEILSVSGKKCSALYWFRCMLGYKYERAVDKHLACIRRLFFLFFPRGKSNSVDFFSVSGKIQGLP